MTEATEVKEPLVNVDRTKYQTTVSASGGKSLNNGDEIATLVDGFSLEAMYFVAKKFIGEDYAEKYGKLNVGMQRMNLGNRIRGHVAKVDKANDKVTEKAKANKEQPPIVTSGLAQLHAIADPIRAKVDEARAKAEADKQKKAEAAAAAKAEKEAKAEAAAKAKADKPKAETLRTLSDPKPKKSKSAK